MPDYDHWTRVPGRIHRSLGPDNPQKRMGIKKVNHIKQSTNPFHVISEQNTNALHKIYLPDGTTLFSEHNTVDELYQALYGYIQHERGTKSNDQDISSPQKIINTSMAQKTLPRKEKLITPVREHTLTVKTNGNENNRKTMSLNNRPNGDSNESTIEFEQIIQKSAQQ